MASITTLKTLARDLKNLTVQEGAKVWKGRRQTVFYVRIGDVDHIFGNTSTVKNATTQDITDWLNSLP